MNKIREKRENLGLTIVELAEKINVHFTSVSEWELEKTIPRPKHRIELAETLNCTKEDLFPELYNEKTELKKASHFGPLKIGDYKISCAVLEDGTRVIVERSMATALGKKGSGTYWKNKSEGEKSAKLPEYASAKYLQPFMTDELKEKLINPISYINAKGYITKGIKAEVLPEICDLWIQAKEKGALNPTGLKTAEKAYILMRGFAKVGIIALVDEATGYQEVRDKKALQKILDIYLLKHHAKWAKRFPDEFYHQIFKLKEWTVSEALTKRPGVVGTYTNNIVYERLAPGILKELQKKNPITENKRREHKHHQYFTEDVGHPELQKHLGGVIALMRVSSDWEQFMRLLDKAYTKFGDTIPLNLNDEERI